MLLSEKGVTLHPLSGRNGVLSRRSSEAKEDIERIAITDKVVQENGAPPGDSSPKVGAAKFCTRHTKFRFSSTIIRRISRSHRNGSDAKLDMSLSVF